MTHPQKLTHHIIRRFALKAAVGQFDDLVIPSAVQSECSRHIMKMRPHWLDREPPHCVCVLPCELESLASPSQGARMISGLGCRGSMIAERYSSGLIAPNPLQFVRLPYSGGFHAVCSFGASTRYTVRLPLSRRLILTENPSAASISNALRI